MLTIGPCMIFAGVVGLGYEALLWGFSGSWLPMTVDDVYRSLGVYDLVANADLLRATASWYLQTPLAALVVFYGIALTALGRWRRRRAARGAAIRPSA